MKTFFQELNLKVGAKATCSAGPRQGVVIVECIKDFNYSVDNAATIIDNASSFVKVIDGGLFGILTSHYISKNWIKI